MSLLGVCVMVFIAWIFCRHKKSISWRTVLWGTALQFIFAILILKTPPGRWFFFSVDKFVTALINFQTEGAKFVFGSLGVPPGQPGSLGFFFAFQVLTTVIFLSSLMSALYYMGLMQPVVMFFARIMKYTCRTSGAETLCAAANIFMGQTEAPLLVKPHLEGMTESELLCVMVGGMATISGGVMVAYVGMLKPYFPDIAGHLLAASVMAAPATLVISKMMIPETGSPKTGASMKIEYHDEAGNVIEAAANGAEVGMRLALNVGAMLIAFMSLLAMVNWGLHSFFGFFHHPGIGLEQLLGWMFSPLAWIIGIPWHDCGLAGYLIGTKTAINEFVAYSAMMNYAAAHPAVPLSERSYVLIAHALCGFSNLLSIAIQIGGIGALAPGRRKDLARLGVYALIGGSLACFMTAAVTGALIP
ncbi:MAG: NupC/NupG family nucleoside CNT transporter [Elusimicrobiota bacterium]